MIGSKHFEIGANEFLAGVTSGANTTDGGLSNETQAINITSVPGTVYAPALSVNKSTNLADEIIASCEDPTYLGKERLFLDDTGNFYSWNGTVLTLEDSASSDLFTQGTTDFIPWYDTSGGTNFYATTKAGANGDIVKWNKTSTLVETWWSGAGTLNQGALSALTAWRPLLEYETNMYVGDQNKLHRIAPDLTVSNGILTLTYTDSISALGVDQGSGRMLIATTKGVDVSNTRNGGSKILIYDGYSNKVSRVVPISGTVTAFKNVGNTTFVFYGNKLGYWTGSGIEYLRTLNFDKGVSAELVYPHRTTSIDNTLYWVDTAISGDYKENCMVMAYGETINNVNAFYPVIYEPAAATTAKPLTCLTAISSTKLGYSFASSKFYTFDTTSVATNGEGVFYTKRKNFPTNVTFNGVIIEFDKVMPASSSSAGIQVIDSNGTTTTLTAANPGVRTDMYEFTSTYPTIETRSIQLRIGMSAALNGIRRITVFYTPKE